MANINVLVSDDNPEVQEQLKATLEKERLGANANPNQLEIKVIIARDADETSQKAERYWDELDVIVSDVRLDEDNEDIRGPEIVLGIRDKKKKSFPPEFIVYSVFHEIHDYYRLALNLGAAAYLVKRQDDPLIHVRVLALRRALNRKNPKVSVEIERIAAQSRSISEAMLIFSQRVLKSAFDLYLGVPFVILFTDGSTTQNCADNVGLPQGTRAFYHTLQALAHGKGNPTEPFILKKEQLETAPDEETVRLYERFEGAAFLPFSLSNDIRLSIAILRPEKTADRSEPSDEEVLVSVLAQHLQPTVLENVINIWSQWTKLRATLISTAKLCLSVGQEINDGLDGLETQALGQLEDLANDLNDTGQYLAQLESRNWHESEAISIEELVREAWNLISHAQETSEIKLEVQGDSSVSAQRSDLEIVFSRLLQWFVYRSKAMPLDIEPVIKVSCEAADCGATITFEDNSHRLPKRLREDLFAPFTQAISTPFAEIHAANSRTNDVKADKAAGSHLNTGRYLPLYLTKMLVEGRYHGLLEDRSDEIKDHSYGHRIVMQFPTVRKLD